MCAFAPNSCPAKAGSGAALLLTTPAAAPVPRWHPSAKRSLRIDHAQLASAHGIFWPLCGAGTQPWARQPFCPCAIGPARLACGPGRGGGLVHWYFGPHHRSGFGAGGLGGGIACGVYGLKTAGGGLLVLLGLGGAAGPGAG